VSLPAAALAAAAALVLMGTADAASGQLRSGERVFQRCFACHSIVAGEDRLPGPNLRTVLGRRAGTLPGFRFSPAMIEAGARGLVWTRPTLDAYLADPQTYLPGTEMSMPPLTRAEDRQAVIEYLEQAGR
jgi:cytochrome c